LRSDGNHAGLEFQRQPVALGKQLAHDMRRAQRGMSRESHFISRRENADPRIGAFGGEHKGGLRKIELARQRLHRFVTHASRILEDTERISAESRFGEDIHKTEVVARHTCPFGLVDIETIRNASVFCQRQLS
jgi:hypothetical protein